MSPVNEIGAFALASGTSSTAIPVVARAATAPAGNTQVVVVLKTELFCMSLIRS